MTGDEMDCKPFSQGWALLKGGPSELMIEVYPMVRTEADMIVNHINHHHIDYHHIDHHHIIHHQGIIYNILNLLNFSTRNHPFISTMIIKKIGWSMRGNEDSLILTRIG